MTHQQILARVSSIVADVVGADGLSLAPAMTAADVDGWDSVANIQIVVAVEKAFDIRLRTGEIASLKNVGELVERIAARTAP